jgi:hypothetical protein
MKTEKQDFKLDRLNGRYLTEGQQYGTVWFYICSREHKTDFQRQRRREECDCVEESGETENAVEELDK